LADAHLDELNNAKTSNRYQPRQVIFYEGNQPFGIYCVSSGKVKVYKSDPEGHQDIVRIAGAGDILGYRCLLSNESYMATAETLELAEICFIDKQTFFHILETHPTTSFRVMRQLATDVRQAEEQVSRLVHHSVRERLAELFLVLRSKYGEETSQGVRLNLTLTRAEWAELVGTTQETVIRLFSQFRQDGILAMEGKKVVLQDIPGLAAVANLID
jgi:CRP/FNR family transcriptional regulator, polysaccharide utilization system transcription regulator